MDFLKLTLCLAQPQLNLNAASSVRACAAYCVAHNRRPDLPGLDPHCEPSVEPNEELGTLRNCKCAVAFIEGSPASPCVFAPHARRAQFLVGPRRGPAMSPKRWSCSMRASTKSRGKSSRTRSSA